MTHRGYTDAQRTNDAGDRVKEGKKETMQVMTDDKGRQIKITRCPFPETIRGKVRGVTSHDKDGFFVVIDSTRGQVAQRRTLGHELAHIFLGHFDRSNIEWKLLQNGTRFITDREIEAEADRYAWKYYRLYEKHRRTITPRQHPHRPTNNRLYKRPLPNFHEKNPKRGAGTKKRKDRRPW